MADGQTDTLIWVWSILTASAFSPGLASPHPLLTEDKTAEPRMDSQNIFQLNEGSKDGVRQDAFSQVTQGPFLFSAVAVEMTMVGLDFKEKGRRVPPRRFNLKDLKENGRSLTPPPQIMSIPVNKCLK